MERQERLPLRGNRLLAHVTGTGTEAHHTLDHLGSPRLFTGAIGTPLSDHHYYGFGEELIPSAGFGADEQVLEELRALGPCSSP